MDTGLKEEKSKEHDDVHLLSLSLQLKSKSTLATEVADPGVL